MVTEQQVMEYFDKKYDRSIPHRLIKFREEVKELDMAAIFCSMKRNPTAEDKALFLDEVSDTLTAIAHIGHILGHSALELMNMAYEKNRIRETNPNYKR